MNYFFNAHGLYTFQKYTGLATELYKKNGFSPELITEIFAREKSLITI